MKIILKSMFILSLFITSLSFAQTTIINGAISLPDNMVAGENGVEVTLMGTFLDDNPLSRQTVTIPSGQTSTNYSLAFNRDFQQIEIECDDCFNLGLINEGAWQQTLGITSRFDGTPISLGTNNNIDIELEEAVRFAGRVLFPENFIASGDELILINFFRQDFIGGATVVLSPSEGEDVGLNFKVSVPVDLFEPTGIFIDITCSICSEDITNDNLFASTLNGDPTTIEEESAALFPITEDHINLILTFQGPFSGNTFIAPILEFILNEEN